MPATNDREVVDQQPKTNAELYAGGYVNKYGINYLKYPLDLNGSTAEFKHWISFKINVRGKSTIRLPNEFISSEVKRDPDSAQLSEDQLGAASTTALAVAGAVAATAGGSIVKDFANKYFTKTPKTGAGGGSDPEATEIRGLTAKQLGGLAVAGAAAGYFASGLDFLKPDTSFRISDAIALYVSEPPAVKYNAQYNNRDLGTLAGMVGAMAGGGSATGSISSDLGEGGAALALKFAQLPQMFGASTADIVGASAKVALNPFKEVLFESVDFRAFSFRYKFMPRSKKEAEEVFNIIEKFKFHMHPELSANKLFYIYPSEFQITYHFINTDNNKDGGGYFHKFKPCVLESMEVNYGGEQFSSFVDGKPTEINLSLVFRETEILTKQQIAQGY